MLLKSILWFVVCILFNRPNSKHAILESISCRELMDDVFGVVMWFSITWLKPKYFLRQLYISIWQGHNKIRNQTLIYESLHQILLYMKIYNKQLFYPYRHNKCLWMTDILCMDQHYKIDLDLWLCNLKIYGVVFLPATTTV